MPLRRLAIVSLAVIAALPPPPMLAQSQNPCVAALAAEGATAMRTPPGRAPKYGRFGADTRDIRDLLQLSSVGVAGTIARRRDRRAARGRSRRQQHRDPRRQQRRPDPPRQSVRPGEHRTPLRTGRRRLRRHAPPAPSFAPRSAARSPSATTTPPRRRSRPRSTFYGRRFTSLFVNSDGNLTFDEADNASTERGLERLASGAPRIAPFFADLDPSAGGRVFFDSAADATTVTWCAVPGFDLPQTDHRAGRAVLERRHRIPLRRGRSHRRHRRAVTGRDRVGHGDRSASGRRTA